ncbi:MAG: DUF1573 domain-containing protein [Candidatus Colwellbacteria bacterium]|nr:DUF1573 domain-containing protein [Candidatus Colwellbacteria bacterium]
MKFNRGTIGTLPLVIGGVFVVVGLLAFLGWSARVAPTSLPPVSGQASHAGEGEAMAAERGSFRVSDTAHDMGSVSMKNGTVSYTVALTNAGAKSAKISSMYTSCMCTTATLKTKSGTSPAVGMPGHGAVPKLDMTIEPNETAEVAVVFDPAAHGPTGIGPVERVIVIEPEGETPFEFGFKATVTP